MEARAIAEKELYTELEEEVFHELEDFVADPRFCAALEKPFREGLFARWTGVFGSRVPNPKEVAAASASDTLEVLSATSEEETPSTSGAESDAPQESFIVVDKKDVVESMAYYIAASIVDMPEAQALTPKQLQSALLDALRVLKRSKFQRVCTWGRRLYRWTMCTYSAVQMYQNPWLMRALVTALWAASRVSMRMLL